MTYYFWLGRDADDSEPLGRLKPPWIYCRPDDLEAARRLIREEYDHMFNRDDI